MKEKRTKIHWMFESNRQHSQNTNLVLDSMMKSKKNLMKKRKQRKKIEKKNKYLPIVPTGFIATPTVESVFIGSN